MVDNEDIFLKRFLRENQEKFSKERKSVFDATLKSNVDAESNELNRLFKDYVATIMNGKYSRKQAHQNYKDFTKNHENMVDIPIATITFLHKNHNIPLRARLSILEWLETELGHRQQNEDV